MSEVTGIIPFSYFHTKQAGSSFLRAEGLAQVGSEFELWEHGRKYEHLIFQKVYWHEMMRYFRGIKILDVCDPDWIRGVVDIRSMAQLIDAITCSSPELTKLMGYYFPELPVVHIPDRLNFDLFPEVVKEHSGKAKIVLWFGYIQNAHETLSQLYPAIKNNDLELRIVADLPYSKDDEILQLNPKFIKFNHDTLFLHLLQSDIILNPKSSKAFFKYKSNNKSLISWKLGIPVAENCDDLTRFLDDVERKREVTEKSEITNRDYNIKESARQYIDLIQSIKLNKHKPT